MSKTKTGALPHSAGFPGTDKVKPKMRVFKFHCAEFFYAVSGTTEEKANEYLFETFFSLPTIDKVEEIPEEQWDEKNIEMHEDNDTERPAFFVSIREMIEDTSTLLFTNDDSTI